MILLFIKILNFHLLDLQSPDDVTANDEMSRSSNVFSAGCVQVVDGIDLLEYNEARRIGRLFGRSIRKQP